MSALLDFDFRSSRPACRGQSRLRITSSRGYRNTGRGDLRLLCRASTRYATRHASAQTRRSQQAMTLGDKSLMLYDCKIAALSKVEEKQEMALHAIGPIIQKFSKHAEVYKVRCYSATTDCG